MNRALKDLLAVVALAAVGYALAVIAFWNL
jgi:hypothetical protein